jgi:hypothetical protein
MLNTTGPSCVGTTGHGTSSRCCRPERALFARKDLLLPSRCCPFAPLCSCEFPARMLNRSLLRRDDRPMEHPRDAVVPNARFSRGGTCCYPSRCCPFAPLCSCEFPARMLNTTGPSFVGTTGHGTSSRCCRPERALFARTVVLSILAMLSIRAVVLMRIPGEDAQQVPPSSGRQGGAIFRRTRASAGSRRGRRSRTATTSGFRNALRSRLLRR